MRCIEPDGDLFWLFRKGILRNSDLHARAGRVLCIERPVREGVANMDLCPLYLRDQFPHVPDELQKVCAQILMGTLTIDLPGPGDSVPIDALVEIL